MMDYPMRTRLKLLGHASVLDAGEHPELVDQLSPEALRKKVERLFLIQVISYDWNCAQYITPPTINESGLPPPFESVVACRPREPPAASLAISLSFSVA
jgi:hypothetical protein